MFAFILKLLSVSPEKAAREKLRQAQIDLVEHQASLEYFNASVPMLKARIARIERELGYPLTNRRLTEAETASARIAPNNPTMGDVKQPFIGRA